MTVAGFWCLPDTGRWRGSDAGFVLKHFQLFWSCLTLNLGHCSFSPSWFGSCFQDGHLFSVLFFPVIFLFFCFLFCFNPQPQPNKSPDDLFFYSTAWWKSAGECQSFLLQHTNCIWKLHEVGTSLCPKQFLDVVNDIIGFLGGVATWLLLVFALFFLFCVLWF